ncbi:lytic transglycosylase domain-containing protein [Halovulum dunhuangense]|uniref:Lytic transglycosylase domain-containing protein n=1 Tax=Halovulum dunhuangense TaxID=1505036 RepID=A0A849KVT0_9RHOB|nr:lytic transglycosylase domain-containing protein [Halovulum dunhuangense]NNU79548.1 lytic transglycosylase domain-containing protein [Halovulum dunhuangense]
MSDPRSALRRGFLAICIPLLAAAPVAAFQPERLSAALDAASSGDFSRAGGLAAQAGDPIAPEIVEWHRLRAGGAPWGDYVRFLSSRAYWPGMDLVRRRAEESMPVDLSPDQVRAFFAQGAAQTGRGALLHAAATGGAGAAEIRARAWRELDMSAADRALYMNTVAAELAPHHAARLERLLWDGKTALAEEMLPLVGGAQAALARARIALQAQAPGVDGAIAAVPASLAGDPGLAHDRMRWRIEKGRWADAEALMRERSVSAASLGRPEAWAFSRRTLARRAMREGRATDAYILAAQHFLSGGSNYADLEFVAGFVALTRLSDPARAAQHFQRLQAAVETPISLGRAGYWLGRAHEAAGSPDAARAAYAVGAQHQTTFYGQLAAERLGLQPDRSITARGTLPDWRSRSFAGSSVVRAAVLLNAAGDTNTALRFILHAQESLSEADSAALARFSLDIGQTTGALRIAKRIVRGGDVYPDAYYPVIELPRTSVAPEFALAVARQESELNPLAVSPVGARGLMQLMPRTAQKVAGDLGLEYSLGRLTADPGYNARLGTQYLAEMLGRYNGSYLLAAAAYNAGPGRVDQWLAELGDPRLPGADPIDWIERIPFSETQNYVMRVLESMHVYRARLTGEARQIGLSQMLAPRG